MKQAHHSRRGQAGLFVVVSLTVLFSTLGLAVDLGWAYYRRDAAQAAADSAALAAAMYAQSHGYTCGAFGVVCSSATTCANPPVNPATNDFEAGCLYAQANGFVTGGRKSIELTGNSTAPPGISGVTPAYWVRANVSESIVSLFGNFGTRLPALSVNTSGIAGVTVTPPAGCIYVLSTNAHPALSLTGTSSATSTCGIFINSNGSPALNMTGTSYLHSTQILINGGTFNLTGGAVVSPTPDVTGGPVTDPLASLPMLGVGACDHTNFSISGSGTVAVSPGVYCGGISISGSGTVNFNPGTYTLNGGGFSKSGSGALNGSEVLFFNTGQGGNTPGAISTSGSATVTFSAPSSGTYQGILFMQDRGISYPATNTVTGSSTSNYSGTLYFPSTALSYSGSSAGTFTALIAKTLTMTGTSVIRNDPTGSHTGLAHKSTAIFY